MQLGMLGLGRMGANMVRRLGILHHALKVVYTFRCHPEGSEVRTTRDLV
jgi:6-phosphogluconate dehydrogenase (decarboxylating)